MGYIHGIYTYHMYITYIVYYGVPPCAFLRCCNINLWRFRGCKCPFASDFFGTHFLLKRIKFRGASPFAWAVSVFAGRCRPLGTF